jgi:aminocarboxymuconate-semialdehyde decarboxylase
MIGVSVLVRPIAGALLRRCFASCGRLGKTFNRGTVNAATLIALVESGTLDELPELRIVVTTLAIGVVLLAEDLEASVGAGCGVTRRV